MGTLQYIIVGVLPIVGVVIGATLQYLFSISSEQRKHQQDLKTQAYVDFIRSFMDAYFKGKKEEYMSRVADATARIAIYGHKEVVEAVANIKRVSAKKRIISESEFESKFESEFRQSFIAMVQAMRKDGLPKESVSDEEISWLLFGEGLKYDEWNEEATADNTA